MRVRWCWTQKNWEKNGGCPTQEKHGERDMSRGLGKKVQLHWLAVSAVWQNPCRKLQREFIELSPWPFTSWQWGWIMGSSHLLSDKSRERSRRGFWYNNLQGYSPSIYSLLRPCVSKCWHFAKYSRPLGLHIPHLSLLGMFCSQT